ncbi:translation elongation factor 4 [Chitinivibrio alkaliphilus]|uniref:Elongation factor 4 n=1 Tax=Chitinivibrio alkaliphilus ACht1 TaxID=1313304 RepID=U7D4J3_9BACT|nr:translation elongation factor 4 [Chitinivibrio alkaliphilus]ERP31429.1 GTP-binding protein LepA [Chitinivibrio alkaliphilus ACht1]
MKQIANIRNFSIIAHIDHGKSTLADRFLQLTGTISEREMQEQLLDDMDLEKERGITIKSHPIQMVYTAQDGQEYYMNLIDTPGHVDFSYEVSRSLAACDGAILVIDAAQGIEAQTLSNIYLAMDNDLTILPVLNKVDLPSARPEEVGMQVAELLGVEPEEILHCSAKTGEGVVEILEQIVHDIPGPSYSGKTTTEALVFDSVFDSYRGAIAYVRIFEGELSKGDKIKFLHTNREYEIVELGRLGLKRTSLTTLTTGQVGYVICNIKELDDIKIGDTITTIADPSDTPITGYKEVKPMVFSGLYPVDKGEYENLRQALDKLKLNDSSLTFEPESSQALGFGFRTGFLGLLHMEITQERLRREFNVEIITTVPNVVYHIILKSGEERFVERPGDLPAPGDIETILEPIAKVQIITPTDYTGAIMKLCEEKRGNLDHMEYLETTRVNLHYHIPMAELMLDFFDKLKSVSSGYASMDYEFDGYSADALVRLDILINKEPVDAFSTIVHRDDAYHIGQQLTVKLKELIPRQMFQVAIQAAIGSKVIARSTVKAYRKDVTAKCYGGDISRKKKLLQKQKEGKKKMKSIGKIELPQKAFLAVLDRNS